MAGFRLLVWYGDGEGVRYTPDEHPQEWMNVTWSRAEKMIGALLDEMERSEGMGVRRIAVEAT